VKRWVVVLSLIASISTLSVSTIASAAVPAKTWNGTVNLVVPKGTSAAVTWFQKNRCAWKGATALNGLDGLVLDVTGYGGLGATATLKMGIAPFLVSGAGYYLNVSCGKIAGGNWSHTADGHSFSITFPTGAKWLVITPTSGTTVVSDMMKVSIQSNGG
jgi:hypothetical protein